LREGVREKQRKVKQRLGEGESLVVVEKEKSIRAEKIETKH
jgi:hypothetical protein